MPADHEKMNVPTGEPGDPQPGVVYNKRTGERIERYPVDCKELVATGEYGWTPPSAAEMKEADEAAKEKEAEQAEAAAAEAPLAPLPAASAATRPPVSGSHKPAKK